MSVVSATRRKGFTLVEVMVSLLIFLVASMGLLPLLLGSLQVSRENSEHARARRLAGEVMAELQVVDYAGLVLAAETPLLIAGIEVRPVVEQNQPGPGRSRLTVTALWGERGRSHSYQLQTVRSKP